MGCARCSICGIHYPPYKSTCEVRGCGEKLAQFSNVEPDVDWALRVKSLSEELERAEVARVSDELRVHRVERFLSLGFAEHAAELLADSRNSIGFPLWWGHVDAMLRAGATHDQALRIYV